ncbi:signal transduction histidine kinase [Inhella inkyongensis]|uniref:histidine kinase n=1 Tax=Inhella inkyongensis TaxID=392593 RepID=A0A840S4I6_9BURK|nr:ATP-binding protein [Inhella inkyongensis]MBB5206207.1 signal transduction histidine kinase [Inhella inkyongensis]
MLMPPFLRIPGTWVLWLVLTLSLLTSSAQAGSQTLNNAWVLQPSEPPRSVALPWAGSPTGSSLQLRFNHARGHTEQQALWLPSSCLLRELRVNGVPLWLDKHPSGCQGSLLLALPAELLRAQDNLLEVDLGDATRPEQPHPARLDSPSIGDWQSLLQAHEQRHALQDLLPIAVGGGLMGLALATGLLALSHRAERRLLWLAACMVCWALVMWPAAASPLLLSPPMGARALAASLCGAGWSLLLTRHLGWRSRWSDPILLALGLGLGLLPNLPSGFAWAPWASWALLLGALSAWFLARRLRSWWRQGPRKAWPELLQHGLLPFGVSATLLACLIPWSLGRGAAAELVAMLLSLYALSLMLGFAHLRILAEQRARLTELRMHERLTEQEHQHRVQSERHLEQVTERERKRIAADLHDDLGAKLLTIVHTSDNERISTLAREALEEMRLSVRGLTGRPVQLLDAVGDWRAEVVSRLNQANIEAEWLSLGEEVVHTLAARSYVQTTRVIREAISNVIKHSGATRCVVRCLLLDDDFQIVIQDNGRGVPTGGDGRLDKGHGMSSMKSRAKQMEGQCLVESGPGWGTLIRLTIPL